MMFRNTFFIHGIIAGFILAAVFTGQAQNQTPSSPLEILRDSNAQLHRFVLENGMICLVKEDHSAPVAAVQIWVGTT